MHEHRVYPGASLTPTFQNNGEHGDVANGRNHHEYAVGDYGDHVAFVKTHVLWQIRLVEHGRVGDVVDVMALPVVMVSDSYVLNEHLTRIGIHYFHNDSWGVDRFKRNGTPRQIKNF